MSIFGSKRRTVVGLTTVPLVAEQTIFNESVLGALFSNTNIAESLSAEMRNGFVGKANRFYREGKSRLKNTGRAVFTSLNNTNEIRGILEEIFGNAVEIYDFNMGGYDPLFMAYKYLSENYNFLPKSRLVQGLLPSELIVLKTADITDNELTMVFERPNGLEYTHKTNNFTFIEGTLIQVMFAFQTSLNKTELFIYDVLDKTYPLLDSVISQKDFNDYFPVIIVRKDKENTIDRNDDYFKETNRLLKIFGADLKEITEQVMTNTEGQSDVVDDCFITFGLPIQNEYYGSIVYLFEYFYRVALDDKDSKSAFDSWINGGLLIRPSSFITFKEDQFNSSIRWNYSKIETKEGVLNKKYERETIINPSYGNVDDFSGYDQSLLLLRKQISDNSYIEITIHGLLHVTEVVRNYTVIRDLEDSLKKPTEESEEDSGFYIPLSKTILDRLGLINKKQVLYASFIMPIYVVQIIKIKWYQRGAFKALLIIIAIVITVVTAGAEGGSAIQVAVAIASQVIAAIILTGLLKIAVDILGIENALILAVIAAAVAVYSGGYSPTGVPWAQELLYLATLSFNAIGLEIKDEFIKLQNEISNFLQDSKELKEELEAAEALLNNSKYNLLDISSGRLYFNPYETPEQFYTRSVYDQNPGVKTYDMLYNYVERMLKLPEHTNV